MPTRPGSPYNGKRYLGNTNEMKVHDLVNEDEDNNACQIDEIKHEHVKMFDYKFQAHDENFRDCNYCIG